MSDTLDDLMKKTLIEVTGMGVALLDRIYRIFTAPYWLLARYFAPKPRRRFAVRADDVIKGIILLRRTAVRGATHEQ
jgi:hypothetical protein